MNVNKSELEEEEKATQPPVDFAAMLAKYDSIKKQGDADYAEAKDRADTRNTLSNVGSVVSNFFGQQASALSDGKISGANSSVFKDNVERNDRNLEGMKADTKSKMNDVWKQDSVAREHVERGQADSKFGQSQQDNAHKNDLRDPKSPKAMSARSIVAKQSGIDPAALENLGYEEIIDFAKTNKQMKDKGLTLTTTVDGQGRTVHAWADPSTGKIIPTGAEKGFALSIDGTTGNAISKSDPNKPSTTIMTDTGEPLRDQNTGLRSVRGEAGKIGLETGKAVVEATKAGARTEAFQDKSKSWTKMYSDAYDANAAGAFAGKAGAFKTKYGFGSEDVADRMEAEIKSYTNNYIKEISGATVPATEYETRFKPLLPSRGDSPALFSSKMKAFEQSLKSYAEERVKEAQALRGLRGQTQPAPTGTAPPKEIKRKTADGRTAIFNESKEFLRYED